MIKKFKHLTQLSVIALGLLSSAPVVHGQFFVANKGDLLAGFRKTGANQGNYELVVNIGNITNFVALAPGALINISSFSPSQLSAAFTSYNNLQWSVSAAFSGSSSLGGFPAATLWYTLARSDTSSQSQAQPRGTSGAQQQTRQRILGVGAGASLISAGLGGTNANNNSVLARESTGDANALTAYIGDTGDPTLGDFQGTFFLVENTTPVSFSSFSRSDLYQACPSGTTDPITHLTTGSAYYVGYFQLSSAGTMTFTRASNVTPPPPPSPSLTISRTGNVSTISFQSTNNAIYTLYYTNSAGLAAPVATWPSLPGTLGGNNSTISFQDTTTALNRFYRVKAQ